MIYFITEVDDDGNESEPKAVDAIEISSREELEAWFEKAAELEKAKKD